METKEFIIVLIFQIYYIPFLKMPNNLTKHAYYSGLKHNWRFLSYLVGNMRRMSGRRVDNHTSPALAA